MKHTRKLFFASAFLAGCLTLCLGACRDFVEPERPEDYNFMAITDNVTWSSVFESFWTGMNNNYLFWSEESVDWDDMYDAYKPKFAALDFKKEADSQTAFGYFREMTKDLHDGHYTLTVHDGFGWGININPVLARFYKEKGADFYGDSNLHPDTLLHSDFFAEEDGFDTDGNATARLRAVENYIRNSGGSYSFAQVGNGWSGLPEPAASVRGLKVTTGRIPESGGFILYFAFSAFVYGVPGVGGILSQYESFKDRGAYRYIDENYPDKDTRLEQLQLEPDDDKRESLLLAEEIRQVLDITEEFFKGLKAPTIKGVIIDLRSNPGGYAVDLSYLWGKLISTERVAAYTRSKLGDNRLDYSPWMPFKIFPDPKNGVDVEVPIAVLVNKRSGSCAEVSAMFFSTLPNAYIVGGTTLGAQSVIMDNRVWNGGRFTGVSFEINPMASVQTRTVDNILYEGRGFPPDIEVPFDEAAYQALQGGRDTRLEKAIQVIRAHQ